MRLSMAILLALCLGVRMLTPPGFMPSFEGSLLAIIPCPDVEDAPFDTTKPAMSPMAMHAMAMPGAAQTEHGNGEKALHRSLCPYAAAASMAGFDAPGIAFAVKICIAALPLQARRLPRYGRHATRDRPPAQAPPILA